jgi:transcription termination factor Rho
LVPDILAVMAEKLAELHLADLHELAAELGVPRYRLLRRERLVDEVKARLGTGEPAVASEPERERAPQPEQKPRREPEPDREREPLDETGTEEVVGALEITPQRYGFLRLRGLESRPDDVYISASQVRRGEPLSDRLEFEKLTPILAKRRVALDHDPSDVLTRAVDLLTPLALGQRVLVMAAARSGRTALLRGLARAIDAAEGLELIVLLIDERPEEATAWREALPDAEIATATADLAPAEQVRLAELALERARRRAESGADAVLIVDSLSRLAVASGKAAEVKHLFGSGRELAEEGAGSLTVIATVVADAEDDGVAERAVVTTESSLIRLDPELAAAGVFPALVAGECRVSNEEELREPEELAAARRLRSLLADLPPAEAANLIRERIEGSRTNAELLASL